MFLQNSFKISILALVAGGLAAQGADVSGPVAGLVFDPQARSIRLMIGVPGAAYLGDTVAAEIDLAAVSPNGELALAAGGGCLYLLRALDSGTPIRVLLEEGAGSPDRIVWNQASTAAAVYSAGTGRLYVWTRLDGAAVAPEETRSDLRRQDRLSRPGLREMPRVNNLGDLSALGGDVSALAVDAAGSALVGIESETSGGLFLISPGGEAALLVPMARPGGIVLTEGDRDLFVTDRARDEVLEVRDFRDGADVVLFANESRGVSDPVAVGLSGDGKTLLVANGAARNVAVYDVDSRSLTARIDLDFEPSRIEPLGESSLYLLNARTDRNEILQVLQVRPDPAVYFVPADSAVTASEANPVED